MTSCRTSLRARPVRPMHTLSPTARQGEWRSRGTERGLCLPKEQRQKRLPVPRSSTLCSSRPAQTDTSLPPVSSRCRATATQFKRGPANWFGLIVLVTVSAVGWHLGTSLQVWVVSGRVTKPRCCSCFVLLFCVCFL